MACASHHVLVSVCVYRMSLGPEPYFCLSVLMLATVTSFNHITLDCTQNPDDAGLSNSEKLSTRIEFQTRYDLQNRTSTVALFYSCYLLADAASGRFFKSGVED